VQGAFGQGQGVTEVATATGLSRQTVYHIEGSPAEAEAALARWGPKGCGLQFVGASRELFRASQKYDSGRLRLCSPCSACAGRAYGVLAEYQGVYKPCRSTASG
jgi:hypothetical protein